ncbi:MAG: ABC transporter permease [Sphaerimonospora mesophila]
MRATLVFALTQLKRFMRDPVALFFSLAFPLLFLFVFGSIFRNDNGVSFDVAIFNHSETQFAKQFTENISKDKAFKKVNVASFDEAKEKMGRGEIDSIIELPKTFGQINDHHQPSGNLVVYYNQASPETGQTVAQVMQSVMSGINQEITGQEPLFKVEQKATTTTSLTQFDYMISGLLGFSILSMGIFGLANQLPAEKKNGSLRRVRATPFTRTQLIFGTLIYYGIVGLLSLTLMLVVALTVFNFDMRGDWLQLMIFLIIAIMMMLGFGLLIGGWARNENQSAVLSNAVSFPLMFLSGVFFPRFLMPEWLQGITGYLPLTPVVDGIRYITTEGATLLDLGPQLAIIGIWFVAIYALAIRFFRWE